MSENANWMLSINIACIDATKEKMNQLIQALNLILKQTLNTWDEVSWMNCDMKARTISENEATLLAIKTFMEDQ